LADLKRGDQVAKKLNLIRIIINKWFEVFYFSYKMADLNFD